MNILLYNIKRAMSWLKKLLRGAKRLAKSSGDLVHDLPRGIAKSVKNVPSFFRLAGTLLEAGGLNVEENIARGYRKITGTGGRKQFKLGEGPYKSSVSLQDLASLSGEIYKDDGGSRDGYETVSIKTVKDLQFGVYRNKNDGHIVVAFRGSDNFANWKDRNLNMKTVDDGFGNKVHAGFKSAWDDLRGPVSHELERLFSGDRFNANITFTGHSLGGAIAQIATADYMTTQDHRLIDIVSFAAPTVGDEGFNDRITPGHHMRVIDPRDSVPKIVQTLQPDFVPSHNATRIISVGDKDARINDRVKKDALRFGLELSFDIGIAMILAYAPESGALFEEEGAAAGFEEEAIAGAEKALGTGKFASEEAIADSFIDVIGGEEGSGLTMSELGEIRNIFNPAFRESMIGELKNISMESIQANIVKVGEVIDWEKTLETTLVGAGISAAGQHIITPFIMENLSEDVSPEAVKFLLDNGFDFMYGAVRAHPVGTYISNVHTQFGNTPDNARADMVNNFKKNSGKSEEVDFMTPKELKEMRASKIDINKQFKRKDGKVKVPDDFLLPSDELEEYRESFVHDEDDDAEGDFFEDDESDIAENSSDFDVEDDSEDHEEEEEVEGAEVHNLGGIESNVVNGRPLDVFMNRSGRKSDGSTIFSCRTETGETLSYTGPSHDASSTTLYGSWTGIAPFANSLPMKVSRTNGFGDKAFSALDTFSMAYLVNSYSDGYHNEQADKTYQKRISAAIRNGFISDAIDSNEHRVALLILKQFKEKGHIFGAEDTSLVTRGNMLSELKMLSRGSMDDSADMVEGVSVNFSAGEKRKLETAFATTEGQGVAREIVTRASNRLSASEVTGTNIIENSPETISFSLRALRSLGLEKTVEYDIIDNGAKHLANSYKTALNLEDELVNIISTNNIPVNGYFSSPLESMVTHDQFSDERLNKSGNEEYLKDRLILEITKTILG